MEKSYNTFSLIIVIYQDNWTPLIWAANGGQTGIVRLLLAAGADVEVKDYSANNIKGGSKHC